MVGLYFSTAFDYILAHLQIENFDAAPDETYGRAFSAKLNLFPFFQNLEELL